MTHHEIEKLNAETFKLLNEAMKLQAERNKMMRETAWYPFVLMTAALATGATIAAALIKFWG